MKTLIIVNRILLRLLVTALVALGALIWLGSADLVQAHIGLGFLFTLLVLVQAVLGAIMKAGNGLVALAVVWALLLPVIGLGQRAFMLGDAHWAVRTFHLLFGLAAMPIVERIAARALNSAKA